VNKSSVRSPSFVDIGFSDGDRNIVPLMCDPDIIGDG
jgi:hypothetical protein